MDDEDDVEQTCDDLTVCADLFYTSHAAHKDDDNDMPLHLLERHLLATSLDNCCDDWTFVTLKDQSCSGRRPLTDPSSFDSVEHCQRMMSESDQENISSDNSVCHNLDKNDNETTFFSTVDDLPVSPVESGIHASQMLTTSQDLVDDDLDSTVNGNKSRDSFDLFDMESQPISMHPVVEQDKIDNDQSMSAIILTPDEVEQFHTCPTDSQYAERNLLNDLRMEQCVQPVYTSSSRKSPTWLSAVNNKSVNSRNKRMYRKEEDPPTTTNGVMSSRHSNTSTTDCNSLLSPVDPSQSKLPTKRSSKVLSPEETTTSVKKQNVADFSSVFLDMIRPTGLPVSNPADYSFTFPSSLNQRINHQIDKMFEKFSSEEHSLFS